MRLTDEETIQRFAILDGSGPPVGSRWRHRRTGTTYTVVGLALDAGACESMVVYQSHSTGLCWVRPLAEWTAPSDGESRFEPLPPAL